ncbi:MAG: NnrS family protein [Thermoanaerobaculia bacterium]
MLKNQRPAPGPSSGAASGPSPLYPRFFLTGIAVTLTAGAAWGAWLLIRIAVARDFAAPSIFEVNAHGQAQIYGWMGLFIVGFALQMFPAFWGVQLAAPRLARALLPLMALAVAVRAVAEARPAGRFADLAVAAGGVQLAVIATFVALLAVTARRGTAPARVADRYLGAGLVWFLLGAALDLRHLARTVGAVDRDALLAEIATWQLPLRDLQIHGLALSMILGVSLRVLPGLLGTPVIDTRREQRARRLFWPLQLAILAEVAIFPLAMATKRPLLFVGFWVATVVFAVAAALAAANLRVFARPRVELSRVSPLAFVRAAHVWLAVSLAMLVMGPFWSRLLGLPFSHAWHGATRHAITVGFVSLMMIGVASRIAPRPAGSGAAGAALPLAPFVLLNLGCTLRVSQQVLTDLTPVAFLPAGVSGLLEVSGLAWWATWIVPRLIRAGRPLAALAETSGPVVERH